MLVHFSEIVGGDGVFGFLGYFWWVGCRELFTLAIVFTFMIVFTLASVVTSLCILNGRSVGDLSKVVDEDDNCDAFVIALALSCHMMRGKKLDVVPRPRQMNLSGGDVDNNMAEAMKT